MRKILLYGLVIWFHMEVERVMISSVYNYYMNTYYGKKYNARNVSTKPEELKKLCVSIAKNNQNSFLYRFEPSESFCKYAIDLKECGIGLKALTNELNTSNPDYVMQKYKAFSDDESVIEAVFTGNDSEQSDDISVRVEQLATSQVNTGYVLKDDELDFTPGKHSFKVECGSSVYDLQFTVRENERNQNILNRVSALINRNHIGIKASVVHGEQGSALRLESENTGTGMTEPYLFSINYEDDDEADILGIDYISRYPSNSSYYINGEHYTSSDNIVHYRDMYILKLNGISQDAIDIHTSYDSESILGNIGSLIESFNHSVQLAKGSEDTSLKSSLLLKNLTDIADESLKTMDIYGIDVDDTEGIKIDSDKLKSYLDSEECKNILAKLDQFKEQLSQNADNLIIDPLNYVNKVLISYNNPSKPYFSAYKISPYAGMMFNYYL